STPVSIAPDIISTWNNGYIVPFKSPEAIADAAITLLSNPELRKTYAANSAKAAKETMSWEKVAKQYQALYQQILRR
ncbi:MAG: glycosyltransferase, partial [Methanocorpusculum sp.]|nr:glycosyltransferase [Methanocorpusculum sp.]